jgi:FAS-associated factor 2
MLQERESVGFPWQVLMLILAVSRPPPKVTLWSILWSPFATLHRILAFVAALLPYLARFQLNSAPKRRQLSPQDTASRFIRVFEELYGATHIPFENRGYADVTRFVKDKDMYFVVVLLSEEHDDTPSFCKDVLCDEQLRDWLRENDCVVWGGNVADSEAHTGNPLSPFLHCD